MKKILFLFLITIVVSSCCTTEYIEVPMEIHLEEERIPAREMLSPIEEDETVKQFLLRRVAYYSELAKAWESWAIYVYEVLDIPLPDSLQSVLTKNDGE
jgi:hypothetical protein